MPRLTLDILSLASLIGASFFLGRTLAWSRLKSKLLLQTEEMRAVQSIMEEKSREADAAKKAYDLAHAELPT